MKEIELVCENKNCNKSFKRRLSSHNYSVKRGRKNHFCSAKCNTEYQKHYRRSISENQKHVTKISVPCTYCSKQIIRKKKRLKKNNFCSTSCANRARYRIKKVKVKPKKITNFEKLKTLSKGNVFEKYKSWQTARSMIAKHARKVLHESHLDKKCHVCGYNLHVEVCHIRDVKDFPSSVKLEKINSLENLIYLCRNHHWELDNGHLTLGSED